MDFQADKTHKGNLQDIFSPATSPRTQQRRSSYQYSLWLPTINKTANENSSTDSCNTVMSLKSTHSQTDLEELKHPSPISKKTNLNKNELNITKEKYKDEPKPTHSKHPMCDQCVVNVSESNSRILKLLDVDDSSNSDSSSPLQTNKAAKVDTSSIDDLSSKDSSDEDYCRICHNSQSSSKDLVSPCHCSGSLGKMHLSCLNQWLQLSKRRQCELCGFKYTFVKESLRFIDFLRDPELRRTHRQLLWDLLSFVLITPISVISIILILLAGQQLQWHFSWDVIGLVTVGFAQLVAYTIWFRIAFQYHKRLWQTWKNKNQVMRLVVQQPKNCPRPSVGGGLFRRKRKRWTRRRALQRSKNNLLNHRFFKRFNTNRSDFRRV